MLAVLSCTESLPLFALFLEDVVRKDVLEIDLTL